MKTFTLTILVPLVLSACANPQFGSEELRLLKPACAAGHWEVCADIGHKVRQAQAESAYLARAQ